MATLFQLLLGDAFDRLPPRVRALHAANGSRTYHGMADVERGSGVLSRFAGAATALPPAGQQIPISVTIEAGENYERWSRDFAGHPMSSRLMSSNGDLCESLGLANFQFRLSVENNVLVWRVRSVSALGIPLPAGWFAGVIASEAEVDCRYRFDVRAELPVLGLLVHYKGWLDVA